MVEGVGVSDEQLDETGLRAIEGSDHMRMAGQFGHDPDGWFRGTVLALLGEVRASHAREAELREAFQQASDSADEWCAKETEWAQAAWDAYGALGFDRDGDETPAAQVGWGPDSLRAFAADAREEADAGDSEEERLHLEYRRVSKEAREKLRAERDEMQRQLAALYRDNLVINKATFMRTHPDSHIGHAPSIAYSELEAERDVLQQRIDKAADVLGLIHASLCMLVMDTPEQQALHDRQMEILDRVRAALTGPGDIATCPTLCDSDCGEQCHEVHQVPYKRGHSPGGCPALCTVLVAERERVEADLLTGVDGEWMDDDATVSVADIRRALYCAAEQSGGVQDHVTGV